jgi:hypothetical protein
MHNASSNRSSMRGITRGTLDEECYTLYSELKIHLKLYNLFFYVVVYNHGQMGNTNITCRLGG